MLGQLGNRIQHALRAFTPDDEKALRATVRTYPKSDVYDLEELLTQLGTGEAAVTILSESGVPTPVVHTRMRPPLSRMGPADDVEGASMQARSLRSTRRESTARVRARCSPRGSIRRPGREAVDADRAAEGSCHRRRRGAGAIGDSSSLERPRAHPRSLRGVFGMLKKSR